MIELKEVKKTFDSFELNCSLKVEKGHKVALIGTKGSGKTTIVKMILNLLHKDSGQLTVLGHTRLSKEDKQRIGVVLDNNGLSEYLSIQDILPMMSQLYDHFHKDEFIHQAHHYQLPLKKEIRTFSKEMKTKLYLLLALSHQPELLVLDDTLQKDSETLDILHQYFIENPQTSLLMTTDNMQYIQDLCDEFYILDQGQIILYESCDVINQDYGILKMDDQQFMMLDKRYIIKIKKEIYGYSCLTNYRQFYEQRYNDVMIIEKGTLNAIVMMGMKGENL